MRYPKSLFVVFAIAAVSFVIATMTGCTSQTSHDKEVSGKPASTENHEPAGNAVIGADYCLQTFMKTPVAAPVHFAYKVNNSDGEAMTWEGDVTAETADFSMFKRQPSTPDLAQNSAYKVHDEVADFTNTFHYSRSQAHDWQMAPTMPVQSGTPWGEFINKPPIERVGPDNVNGFEAVKYAVDNSKQDLMDRVGFTGVKDYKVNGSLWLTKDSGCILQWTMDSETTLKDGSVSKIHYEGTVTKK